MLVVHSGVEDRDDDARTVVAKVPHRLVEDVRVADLGASWGVIKQWD